MLLNLAEDLHLEASPEDVWKLLRDTPRFAGLLPGVESVKAREEADAEAYDAIVHDKIGPFKVTLNLELRVIETAEPALLRASVKGADAHNLNRVSGTLQAALRAALPSSGTPEARTGTQMRFEASVEVVGKLATLGAIPMKRRTTQLFAEFARNIQGQFARENS
jgi:carbon monoxide dehydrogenase subunit G